jgi:hypothetical protein
VPWRIVLGGGAAIVIFDALAASAAKALDLDYALAAFGSVFIYAVVGRVVRRTGRDLRACALAGAAVALIDATAGWAVSGAIVPDQIEDFGAVAIVGIILGAMLLGALFGWVGGRFGGSSRPSAQA